MTEIRNIILDIGNVIVEWNPERIIQNAFGESRATPELTRAIFGPDIWHPLNRGEINADEAKQSYCRTLGLSAAEADQLFDAVLHSLDPVPGTHDLMTRFEKAGYAMFALSDNVHEIVAHLKERHDFWRFFKGAAISAELGVLKPGPEIYQWLLAAYNLIPDECVFLDDVATNVEGARTVGLHAFQFTTAVQAERDLAGLGLIF